MIYLQHMKYIYHNILGATGVNMVFFTVKQETKTASLPLILQTILHIIKRGPDMSGIKVFCYV